MVRQERIVTQHFAAVDPSSIDDYIRRGGYERLHRALKELGPGRVLDEVARSRLRGRGGDGLDVAMKWRSLCEAEGQPKYVVCNAYDADERAPIGRTLLEQSPHIVLEGMIIAAFAVGAARGFIYCRGDAFKALSSVTRAVEQARERGFIGFGVLETDFDFEMSIARCSAGFIGGEETAMLAAMSGRRAMPSQQPPSPAQFGLRGRPTLIHSAETLAAIPWIVANGGDEYARVGTESSTGTKLLALDGDVRNKTLVELPFGVTVREAVVEIGEGPSTGRAIKAVHIGGPLGGCIPESLLDRPLDYDVLRELGTTVGSGRLTVLNEGTCLAGYAQKVMSYLSDEACGKCVPCRLGTKRTATVLEGITSNLGQESDVELISELSQNMRDASLCGFGIEAPNIVATSLKYFGEDYRQHLERGSCPTDQCRIARCYRYQRKAVL